MKKVLPPVIALLLLLIGTTLIVHPDWVALPGVPQTVVKAVIIHESGVSKPLTSEMVEVLAKAPSLGIAVWDKDLLGRGRQPSPEAKPFLEAAGTEGLPKLVLQFKGGGMTTKPCPATFDALKTEIGAK